MDQPISGEHRNVDNGNPAGGTTIGTGITIEWQNGPMKEPDGSPRGQNGAFVEGVINAAIDRLEYYQGSQFRCRENALAITKLEEAKHWLQSRTRSREALGVEGTHGTRPSEG